MVHAFAQGPAPGSTGRVGTKSLAENPTKAMALLKSLKAPIQTMEIKGNQVYLNGDLYNKETARQVLAHWHILAMLDDVTFRNWQQELKE